MTDRLPQSEVGGRTMSARMQDYRLNELLDEQRRCSFLWKAPVNRSRSELLDALVAERAHFTSQAEEIERLRSQVEAACASPDGCAERDRYKAVVDAATFARAEVAAGRFTTFQFEQYVCSFLAAEEAENERREHPKAD